VEFGFLRSSLVLTAGNLSQHLGVLEKAGLVWIEKGYAGKRGRTWIHLSPAGEKALRNEIAHLKRLIGQIEQTAAADPADSGGRPWDAAREGPALGADPAEAGTMTIRRGEDGSQGSRTDDDPEK
jgi:Winged helix DNA-binding domain